MKLKRKSVIVTVDKLAHNLHLPDKLIKPICDYYDIHMGIPKEDIVKSDYKGKAPWWLR